MKNTENQIFQHFKDSEQEFVSQILNQINQVQSTHVPLVTPFMNPRERYIVQSIVNGFDEVKYSECQELSNCEENRAIIYPYYLEEPCIEDYEIALIEINYPQKFASLSHGQILGAILGAGIVRDRMGDILTDGDRWQFFTDEALTEYLIQQVNRIGRTTVELKEIAFSEMVQPEDTGQQEDIVVSTLRIDSVIARAFNLSRKIAQEFIQKNRVKLNWVEVTHPAEVVETEDILSVRGKGRIRIGEIKNRTKKDNLILNIVKYDRNQK